MRLHFLALITAFVGAASNAYALSSMYCGTNFNGFPYCVSVSQQLSESDAAVHGLALCHSQSLSNCSYAGPTVAFSNQCRSVAAAVTGSNWYAASGPNAQAAQDDAITYCGQNIQHVVCATVKTICDVADNTTSRPTPSISSPSPASKPIAQADATPTQQIIDKHAFDFLNDPNFYRMLIITKLVEDVWTGISIGIGILLVIVIFAKRAPILNYVIHGNLPYKLPVYGEDIQCLFKRTQRENWYGRVVFGIVVNLAMTHQQLIDVRNTGLDGWWRSIAYVGNVRTN